LVLPLIDLLILLGWTTLSIGAVLKAVYVTTSYRPTLMGLTPIDCALAAGVFLLLSLALAARTWVKLNEPRLVAARRSLRAQGMYDVSQGNGNGESSENGARVEPASPEAPRDAASVRGAGGIG
jgi:hypothetical protein